MKNGFTALIAVLVAVVAVIGGRWYIYVSNTESPYDEVGITLNGFMPAPLRAWGCAKLHGTFAKGLLPPMGCERPGKPREWL